jgi:urease accessory protein UreF
VTGKGLNLPSATFTSRHTPPLAAIYSYRAAANLPIARLDMLRRPEFSGLEAGRADEWLGDIHPLVQQLGCADGLTELHAISESLQSCPVANPSALQNFLRLYHEQVLVPYELPVIHAAYEYACRGALRELVALDQEIAGKPALREFAAASERIGKAQLLKLRPLRDERVAQRYLHAVEAGEAHGWNTLVYGLTLALYSLPLRQGLLGYAWQTTNGFIHAAARSMQLTEKECRALLEERCESVSGVVETLVGKLAA